MENSPTVPSLPQLNPKNSKVLILPGFFDSQNPDHTNMIHTLKNSFHKVHLVLGILNEPSESSSTPELDPKIQGVDEVFVFEGKPSKEDIERMSFDYVAVVDPNDYRRYEKVIILNNGRAGVDEEAVKDFEDELRKQGRWSGKVKLFEMSNSCKKKLKSIKMSVWQRSFSLTVFENAISKSRKYLQDSFVQWDERMERILRAWMAKGKSSTSTLMKLLKEVWDNA